MSQEATRGILNLNKPPGLTSRRVVDRVARLARPAKVGHAGTLDPLATGVLLVAVGSATRLIEYLQRQAKRYRAVIRLGAHSATDDVESPLEPVTAAPVPSLEEVQAALQRFLGRIRQQPPVYSAVHIHGRRAYELARRGKTVVPEPKWVEIHQLELLSYSARPTGAPGRARLVGPEYSLPRLELDVLCGSGTYIRSLARDLGRHLGCGGVLEALTRTAVGSFGIADAVDPAHLTAERWQKHLHSLLAAVPDLPRVALAQPLVRRLSHGQSVPAPSAEQHGRTANVSDSGKGGPERSTRDHGERAVLDPHGRLIAIAILDRTTGNLRPHRVLVH